MIQQRVRILSVLGIDLRLVGACTFAFAAALLLLARPASAASCTEGATAEIGAGKFIRAYCSDAAWDGCAPKGQNAGFATILTNQDECTGGSFCCVQTQDAYIGSASGSGATSAGGSGSPTVLEDPLKGIGLIGILNRIIQTFLGIAGSFALLVFVYAGIMYMTAGSSDRVKTAVNAMKYAFLGIIIILFSYIVTSYYIQVITTDAAPTTSAAATQ